MKRHIAPLLLILAAFGFSGPAVAAPKADLWDRWLAQDPASAATVDHSEWNRLLKTYVVQSDDGVNRVAYDSLRERDQKRLEAYLATLGATAVSSLNRPEQRAYWLNLYNALTIKVVLDHYPVDSIREIDISPGLFANGPWGAKLFQVEGEQLSLDDIEHRILRPIWQDPRVHYGVNCASYGCPNLLREAFTAQNADALLDEGAKAYINSPRGASFDGDRLTVSSIYDWFEEDFGASEAGVIDHLKRYAEPELKRRLSGVDGIDDYAYDWALNAVR